MAADISGNMSVNGRDDCRGGDRGHDRSQAWPR